MTPTARELQVLVAVVEHSTERAAAKALGISIGTVKGHLQLLYGHIGARDRAHAAALLWPVLRDRYRLPGDRFVERRRAA